MLSYFLKFRSIIMECLIMECPCKVCQELVRSIKSLILSVHYQSANSALSMIVFNTQLLRPWIIVVSLIKMLPNKYLCLMEFNKQQIEEVRSKTKAKNSKAKATPKRVLICAMHVPLSLCRDRRIKMKKSVVPGEKC